MFSILLCTYCYSRMLRIESFSSNVIWLKNTKLQTYVIDKLHYMHRQMHWPPGCFLIAITVITVGWAAKTKGNFVKLLTVSEGWITVSVNLISPRSAQFFGFLPFFASSLQHLQKLMTNLHHFLGLLWVSHTLAKLLWAPLVCWHLQNHNCVNNRLTDCCFHLYRNIQKHAGIDIFFLKCLSRAKHVTSRAGPVGRGGGQGESGRSELTALMTWLSFSYFSLFALDDCEALLEATVDNCCIDLFYYQLIHSISYFLKKKKITLCCSVSKEDLSSWCDFYSGAV